jgi:hypothetical protein
LKEYINEFTILIYGSPKTTLLAINFNKHLINEKRITKTVVFFRNLAAYLDPNLLHHNRIDS